jgi:uncharacterized membrane protein
MYILRVLGMPFMHAHVHSNSGAGVGPVDRAGDAASPSDGPARRRLFGRFRPTAFKPVTYSIMHLAVAVSVAYVLTRDWRIALGVGIIEPMVQTVAYMLHEKAWSRGGRTKAEARGG